MNIKTKKMIAAVRLSQSAYEQLSSMCENILSQDPEVKINLSKLLSFIIEEFQGRYFEKSKERIITLHRDKRKDAKKKLDKISEEQLESVMKVLGKLKIETNPQGITPMLKQVDNSSAS